ncbi:MAG: LysR substrate-binding domain-containing protein [Gemmatimonadota bacterium]
MNIRQLRYFLAVAEHRHFTRAAEASYVSQPALSQQIQSLERELDAPLFDRLSTGVRLTTAGRALRGYAERVLKDVENARVAVEEAVGAVRGELTVAAVHTANLSLVVRALARFRDEHPDVTVRVREESSAAVVDSVSAGRVNLGICYLPGTGESIQATPLYVEELVLVVPLGHALSGGPVPLSSLAELPLIVPPDGLCLRLGIDEALGSNGSAARIVAEISAPESICAAVRAGLGVTLLPSCYAGDSASMAGLRAIPIDPAPQRSMYAIRHADRHLCLASRAFMATLQACLGEGAADPELQPRVAAARSTA